MLQIRELNFKSLSGLFIDVIGCPQEPTKLRKKPGLTTAAIRPSFMGRLYKKYF